MRVLLIFALFQATAFADNSNGGNGGFLTINGGTRTVNSTVDMRVNGTTRLRYSIANGMVEQSINGGPYTEIRIGHNDPEALEGLLPYTRDDGDGLHMHWRRPELDQDLWFHKAAAEIAHRESDRSFWHYVFEMWKFLGVLMLAVSWWQKGKKLVAAEKQIEYMKQQADRVQTPDESAFRSKLIPPLPMD